MHGPLAHDTHADPSFRLEEWQRVMHDDEITMNGISDECKLDCHASETVGSEQKNAQVRRVQETDIEIAQREVERIEEATGGDTPKQVENQRVVHVL